MLLTSNRNETGRLSVILSDTLPLGRNSSRDNSSKQAGAVMKTRSKILVGTGAVALAGLGVGLGLAWPLTSSGFSGTETFSGIKNLTAAQTSAQNFVPTIPLTASGPFSDTGSIYLTPGSGKDGNGPGTATIKLANGDLNVHHAASLPANAQPVQLPGSSCTFSVTQKTGYTVVGGTGKYAGATGHGVATVTFNFTLPRLPIHSGHITSSDGACDTSNSAMPLGGQVVFSAVGPVTAP